MESHAAGDTIEDVWASSFVGRAQYNLLAFGASDRALEYIAHDRGVPLSDNPSLSNTELRRAIFNTAVTQRTTLHTTLTAIRYLYPDLWPYTIVCEDVRWPGAIVIWYSTEVITDDVRPTAPEVEPWETWIDHLAWPDGFPLELFYDTYLRDPVTDVTYDGDYFLTSGAEDPDSWPFPVVVSGPDISIIGTPAPKIPAPVWVSSEYRSYLVRPPALDRALPIGVGVLLLDYGLM
jgi:hypothetical protein